jgi:hypothetical protein
MALPVSTLKALIEKRTDIEHMLSTNSSSSLRIEELTAEFFKISNANIIKLSLDNKSLYFKPETINILCNLEHCIDHMYSWLSENTDLVSTKYQNFVKVLRQNNISGICSKEIDWCYIAKIIRESKDFDIESLIDCELLACALKDIVYNALSKM